MIERLRGELVQRGEGEVLVDVGGVGYAVAMPPRSADGLGALGAAVVVHTHLVVREDAHALFGFATEVERAAFRLLIAVNGVGPRLALAVLGVLDPAELAGVIARGDTGRLTKVPGVGKKSAERLIVELKDKIGALPVAPATGRAPAAGTDADAALRGDLRSALVNLGYRAAEAEAAIDAALASSPRRDLQAVLRVALKGLSR